MDNYVLFILGAIGLFFVGSTLFLLKKLLSLPSLEDLEQDVDDLYLQVEKLQNDLQVYVTDVYDKVEGILSPMSKRMASRQAREKEKDLNSSESLEKRTGMISLAEARKYGLVK